jgi:CheY-like chemotaxis protein
MDSVVRQATSAGFVDELTRIDQQLADLHAKIGELGMEYRRLQERRAQLVSAAAASIEAPVSANTVSSPLAPAANGPAPSPPPVSAKVRILVVEDDEISLKMLTDILTKNGYEVSQATTGETAVRLLKDETINLVVSDIGLPGMSGIELAQEIRSSLATRRLPIVFCTASGEKTDIQAASRLNVSGYILKPYDAQLVLKTIRRALESSEVAAKAARIWK